MINPFASKLAKPYLFIILMLFMLSVNAQIPRVDPASVEIVRDSFGVPHIFSKTDAGVVYGVGWATCEDDFTTLQWGLLAGKAMLGRHLGLEGARIDFAVQLLGVHRYVDEHYDTEVPDDMKVLYQAYADAVNDYAAKHPEEVLVKKAFPASPHDLVTGYSLSLALMGGIQGYVERMVTGNLLDYYDTTQEQHVRGSNAFAFNSSKTKDGSTFLNVNSHQPLEGPMSWYEIHCCSEEGWNCLGGTFHGGICVFHGSNENLGWAHTVNEDIDLIDAFKLQMKPGSKKYYYFDGELKKLIMRRAKLTVALGKKKNFVITVHKKYWESIYGPTMLTKKGAVSIRMEALRNIKAGEQWFRMNKARNFSEFRKALDIQGITMQNFTYADRFDTIYKLSNALIPCRTPGYNWKGTVPGNTSKTLWTKIYPVDSLPQYLNPKCGWVFNCNNSSIEATSKDEIWPLSHFNKDMGFDLRKTSRGERFYELMTKDYPGKIDYADFKNIKYDHHYPDSVIFMRDYDINDFLRLDATKYPDIADAIAKINHWNKRADADNRDIAMVLRALYYVYHRTGDKQEQMRKDPKFKEEMYVSSIRMAKDSLLKNFGSIDIPLTEFQRHQRGNVDLGVEGGPDMLNASYANDYQNGRMRIWVGDSYIQLVHFDKNGTHIESVTAYGASNKPTSPHYTDQMKLYVNHQLKPMTFDKKEIYSKAEKIYHPR